MTTLEIIDLLDGGLDVSYLFLEYGLDPDDIEDPELQEIANMLVGPLEEFHDYLDRAARGDAALIDND